MLLATSLFSCAKETVNKYLPYTSENTGDALTNAATHYIGEYFGGGVIYWLDTTGEHGLVASVADIGFTSWRNGTFVVTGAKGTAIGTSASNTRKIIRIQGRTGNYAALLCAEYSNDGYSDWFLPSVDELNALFIQKNLLGGVWGDGYWSSTENARHFAWYQYFVDGYQNFFLKSNNVSVRAIRYF